MEAESGIRSVAYEMLGPPRLSKLLFEAEILSRIYPTLEEAGQLDPDTTAERAHAMIQDDEDLRQRIVTIGLPIVLPDGEHLLRGPQIRVAPEADIPLRDQRLVDRGWVDLRPQNWALWQTRFTELSRELRDRAGVEMGSAGDHEYGDLTGVIRPGRMAAWIFRYEDKGERIKR